MREFSWNQVKHLSEKFKKELLERFPQANERKIEETANVLARLAVKDEIFLKSIKGQISSILSSPPALLSEHSFYKLELEDHIRQQIFQDIEKVYSHFGAFLLRCPEDEHTFSLMQAIMFEALRKGSQKVKERIRKDWKDRRLFNYLEEINPEDILGRAAYRMMEEEYPADILLNILNQAWLNEIDEPLIKFITRRVFNAFKEIITKQKLLKDELSPLYWLKSYEDLFDQQGIPFVVKRVAPNPIENRKLIIGMRTYVMEGVDEIECEQSIQSWGKWVHNLNRLYGELNEGRKIVEIPNSPDAPYDLLKKARVEGILWPIMDLAIEDLKWLSQNVNPETINRTEVKNAVRMLSIDIDNVEGSRKKREAFRGIARGLWTDKHNFSLGPLDKLQVQWDIPTIWLAEIIFKERENHEKHIS